MDIKQGPQDLTIQAIKAEVTRARLKRYVSSRGAAHMNPLPPAPLTQEDWLVWMDARHGFRGMPWLKLIDAYKDSDRRDAELMRLIEVARKWETDHPEEFLEYLGWGFVHCLLDTTVEDPGTCIRFEGSDITFCA